MVDFLGYITRETGATLKRAAITEKHGEEYAGPCPMRSCNRKRDGFRVQPNAAKGPQWMCRGCTNGIWKNAPSFVLAWRNLPYSDENYFLACRELGMPPAKTNPDGTIETTPPAPPEDATPPNPQWLEQSMYWAEELHKELMACDTHFAERAWGDLERRGFTQVTVKAARLGVNGGEMFERPEAWGLQTTADRKAIWIPQGITIPWFIDKQVWRLNVRRWPTPEQEKAGETRYIGPAGFGNGLYLHYKIKPGRPVVLCEGEFDALAVNQVAGDLVTAVATGSTDGSRRMRWIDDLAKHPVLLGQDNDGGPGDQAADWWQAALGSKAHRLRPSGAKDLNEMLQKFGPDLLRLWIERAIPGPHGHKRLPVYSYQCPLCRQVVWLNAADYADLQADQMECRACFEAALEAEYTTPLLLAV